MPAPLVAFTRVKSRIFDDAPLPPSIKDQTGYLEQQTDSSRGALIASAEGQSTLVAADHVILAATNTFGGLSPSRIVLLSPFNPKKVNWAGNLSDESTRLYIERYRLTRDSPYRHVAIEKLSHGPMLRESLHDAVVGRGSNPPLPRSGENGEV